MSGRLILLPHKTWNVWNREAIAKVRNDEKAHEEELEAARQKKLKVESEARIELLRKRQQGSNQTLGEDNTVAAEKRQDLNVEGEHINLFADLEHAMGINLDHAEEKKAREREELKKVGGKNNLAPLALGGTSAEREKDTRWWGDFVKTGGPTATTKARIEPTTMNAAGTSNDSQQLEEGRTTKDTKHTSDEKKHSKKSSKKKSHKVKKDLKKKDTSATMSLEALRAKRLEREAQERVRASEVLSAHGIEDEATKFINQHNQKKRYNSQYFPTQSH
jgi:hypothetical protein